MRLADSELSIYNRYQGKPDVEIKGAKIPNTCGSQTRLVSTEGMRGNVSRRHLHGLYKHAVPLGAKLQYTTWELSHALRQRLQLQAFCG